MSDYLNSYSSLKSQESSEISEDLEMFSNEEIIEKSVKTKILKKLKFLFFSRQTFEGPKL